MKEHNDIELEGERCGVEDCNDDCTVEICEAAGCTPCSSIEALQKVGAIDVILSKVISRKLLVFGVATGLLMWYGLDPDTWGLIAMIYVGGQSIIDTVKVWKHGA